MQPQLQLPLNAPMNAHVIGPQFPMQSNLNPNKYTVKKIEMSTFLSSNINPLECNNVHLRSRRIIYI